ncbi:MAG: hypothetical protein RIR51_1898 [Bacteroidota bacterium]|jgi:amino acid transporter
MKKLILLIAIMVLGTISLNAQTVNGLPIGEIDSDYLEIIGRVRGTTKVAVEVDFGQGKKFGSNLTRKNVILDENGKSIVFNSIIDALNFFSFYGYEFVNAYAHQVGQTDEVQYHYILRRKE